jgi:hypothetical protein
VPRPKISSRPNTEIRALFSFHVGQHNTNPPSHFPLSRRIDSSMAVQGSTQRRATISTVTSYTAGQRITVPRNGMCTHLTMTRLYTRDFRCALCYNVSSRGWLWRCTQDRELMLEEDMGLGFVVNAYHVLGDCLLIDRRINWTHSVIYFPDQLRHEKGVPLHEHRS